MSKAVVRQMLSVGLQGLAGCSQLRCNLDTFSAELLLPRLQHLDAPLVILYAMYTMDKRQMQASTMCTLHYIHSLHIGSVCVCVCACTRAHIHSSD